MPRRPENFKAPRDHVIRGDWPEAELHGPPEAVYAQEVARRLRDAIGARSLKEVAREAGIADVTVKAILDGKNYTDIRTIARLEAALGKPLLADWRTRRRTGG